MLIPRIAIDRFEFLNSYWNARRFKVDTEYIVHKMEWNAICYFRIHHQWPSSSDSAESEKQ